MSLRASSSSTVPEITWRALFISWITPERRRAAVVARLSASSTSAAGASVGSGTATDITKRRVLRSAERGDGRGFLTRAAARTSAQKRCVRVSEIRISQSACRHAVKHGFPLEYR
jgi:hypothetical protein